MKLFRKLAQSILTVALQAIVARFVFRLFNKDSKTTAVKKNK